MAYQILCEVTGGRTGNRTSLYQRDGVVVWADREEAQAEADRCNRATNDNPHQAAQFSYTVITASEG